MMGGATVSPGLVCLGQLPRFGVPWTIAQVWCASDNCPGLVCLGQLPRFGVPRTIAQVWCASDNCPGLLCLGQLPRFCAPRTIAQVWCASDNNSCPDLSLVTYMSSNINISPQMFQCCVPSLTNRGTTTYKQQTTVITSTVFPAIN